MSCGKHALIVLFMVMALSAAACSNDSSDDSCDKNEDCITGWGWVCVNHKCILPDGDNDSESGDGESGGVKPCSRIDSEEECLEDAVRCMWEDDVCKARQYTPDGDYDSEYSGSNPGQNGEGCRYLDYEECSMWPQCDWIIDMCTASGVNPNDCSKYRTESECARGYGCRWNGYACVSIQ